MQDFKTGLMFPKRRKMLLFLSMQESPLNRHQIQEQLGLKYRETHSALKFFQECGFLETVNTGYVLSTEGRQYIEDIRLNLKATHTHGFHKLLSHR